jgi:opacity protein-like surface antigen
MRKRAILGIVLCGGLSVGLRAQDDEFFHSEANVSAIGTFNNHADGKGIRQGTTDSGGVLVNYRYLFTRHQGVEVDYSFFKDTQLYTSASSPRLFGYGVHNAVDEVTASYVYRLPLGRLVPYVSAGTGAVVFAPGPTIQGFTPGLSTTATTSSEAKATFVYGGGVDVGITRHLSFRVGYRGLLYKAPGFSNPVLKTGSLTHLAETVGGLTFRF